MTSWAPPRRAGKTAAFGLPLLQRLAKETPPKGPRKPRALVLVPTRELAVQVADSIKEYGRHMRLNVTMLFGGVGMQPQIDNLRRGVDILVACPGRLLDHLDSGHAKLDAVEMLVLDEADRMLDMGFLPSIKRVLARVPSARPCCFGHLRAAHPRAGDGAAGPPGGSAGRGRNTIADTIVHRVHPVDASRKRDLLVDILAARHTDRVLVFGRTKHGCNRLAEQLGKAGLPSVAIHGNKSQAQRQKALDAFKAGRARILVATDVAARGLDIPDLPLVINHDLPMVAEDYVHRIGRTGRNGAEGEALSLVAPEEGGLLRDIQRMLKAEITMETVPGFEPSQPLQMNAKPAQGRGGQRPGGQQRKPANRSHGKPQQRAASPHAGPRQHRGGGRRRRTA